MKPKKSLGQNFLKDRNILEKIIKAANLKVDDLVIEIGPGEGVLTKELARNVCKLICIEKDEKLAQQLVNNFEFQISNFKSISNDLILNFKNKTAVISGDVLKINLPELIDKNSFHNYKVVANIPYYITSPIIQLFLETKFPPKEMVLMVQKEVAERICADPGNMSILAVSVQYYAKPELLFYVDKTAFWPVPEVNSAVIKITPFSPSPPLFEHLPSGRGGRSEERKRFFRVVRAGFCAKRKVLSNNLSSSFHISKQEAEEKIKKAGIDPGSRAQELSVDDWKKLEIEFS
jgi:16S rRNA (adenine1518-N6/adenine1519-N6)-dimethyltransferase